MMDSQENILQEEQHEDINAAEKSAEVENLKVEDPIAEEPTTEEKSQAETAETPAEPEPQQEDKQAEAEVNNDKTTAEEVPVRKFYKTIEEVLDRVKEISHNEENPDKDELDNLKTTFYKLHIIERDAQQKAYIEQGGDPEKYVVLPDEKEETFKAEMQIIKEKRSKFFHQQEEEKQSNYQKKLEIIDKIKMMATSPDEANKSFNEFKELQQQWKEIKAVPAEKANELWRNYQLYVEQFYDLLNLNREAREYDFKKNMELKIKLCEAAERLADETDVISAFHQLQKLHQQYREIGPVAKEQREEIWNRFKAASTVINKRHQEHFEALRSLEEDNLNKKTALCERVEAIAKEENKSASDWEKHTKEIIGLQAEWKKIGFAPQKMNIKIFDRFRAGCDEFFGKKAEYFKQTKERFAENAEKKKALVAQAEALKDSTDWKATSDKMIALQKEWKTIGMVPKKLSNQLWNDFLAACNHFFEARNAANSGAKNEERTNLDKKREIIGQLKALTNDAVDNVQERVQELIEQFNAIGHVPFRDKDRIYKEFHDVIDQLYKDLNISVARRRIDNFKSNLKNVAKRGDDALDNERGRLMHRYEQLKQEISTYENNLGFLNASSKKGNSLIDEMNRKVQKLKDDVEMIRQKIKAIDAQNKEE